MTVERLPLLADQYIRVHVQSTRLSYLTVKFYSNDFDESEICVILPMSSLTFIEEAAWIIPEQSRNARVGIASFVWERRTGLSNAQPHTVVLSHTCMTTHSIVFNDGIFQTSGSLLVTGSY